MEFACFKVLLVALGLLIILLVEDVVQLFFSVTKFKIRFFYAKFLNLN